ncbi:hypothetical protein VTH8203_02759 [Vibrio thalassae]|uniref:Uncharacterized protein n=1 Tax=Vibrio thalassae TaxID=1243014 RepID=A0A240EKA6_9VIBR|nr:hypothetical protein [Vibrio thalassae]SNX49122.1 hypothetical protein VTH8203_02759 [Vibrio thalassae]
MMFVEQAAERLQLDIRNLTDMETKFLIAETYRDINRAVLQSLALNQDGENLKALGGAKVRFRTCNFLRFKALYNERDVREMLGVLVDCRKPEYEHDVYQVGWLPYCQYVLFWHIQAYRNKRLINMYRLPARDYSDIEFRVYVSAEIVENK